MQLSLILGPAFIAGIAMGFLVISLLEYFRLGKRRDADQAKAEGHIIAQMRQEHEKEVVRQIFQIVEQINGKTAKSINSLLETLENLLIEIQCKHSAQIVKTTGDGNNPERIEPL